MFDPLMVRNFEERLARLQQEVDSIKSLPPAGGGWVPAPAAPAPADTGVILDAEAFAAGILATYMRSDAKPGLRLVGAPGDATDDTATLYASLEFVKKTDLTRRGLRVKLGTEYPTLEVTADGLHVKLDPLGGIVADAGSGLAISVGDGLEIDANVLKAIPTAATWVADP